ncbi:MAG: hypothetical protein ACTSRP_01915 [Candidatus Helarchaeota archaeon]
MRLTRSQIDEMKVKYLNGVSLFTISKEYKIPMIELIRIVYQEGWLKERRIKDDLLFLLKLDEFRRRFLAKYPEIMEKIFSLTTEDYILIAERLRDEVSTLNPRDLHFVSSALEKTSNAMKNAIPNFTNLHSTIFEIGDFQLEREHLQEALQHFKRKAIEYNAEEELEDAAFTIIDSKLEDQQNASES